MTYFECWKKVASALFSQALAGAPELAEALPAPLAEGAFGFAAKIGGEEQGRFIVLLDPSVLDAPLMGENADQRSAWGELLREVANAAAGELVARGRRKCCVEAFEDAGSESQVTAAFALRAGEKSWPILVCDEVHAANAQAGLQNGRPARARSLPAPSLLSPGVELLLDIELEASLRFGCREMPLGEILDLGPGDVVQLDRHVSDPVDLIVGDKIVARGDVVLVNGNFGLRVTEVAAPRKRLESIRCLF